MNELTNKIEESSQLVKIANAKILDTKSLISGILLGLSTINNSNSLNPQLNEVFKLLKADLIEISEKLQVYINTIPEIMDLAENFIQIEDEKKTQINDKITEEAPIQQNQMIIENVQNEAIVHDNN